MSKPARVWTRLTMMEQAKLTKLENKTGKKRAALLREAILKLMKEQGI